MKTGKVARATETMKIGEAINQTQYAHTLLDQFVARVTEARLVGMTPPAAHRHVEDSLGRLLDAAILAGTMAASELSEAER